MDKRILATYFHGTGYGYDWLQDEEEVKEWLNEYAEVYENIEIIKINVVEEIYNSEDIIEEDTDISWDNEENIEDGISTMYPNENMEEALWNSFDKFTS